MFRLKTLGAVSLETEGVPLTGRATQRRRLALLALLAAHEQTGLSRDKVIAYLWPERDTEQGRHSLSQTLYALRRELGPEAIIAGIDDLRLNAQVVTSDVAELNAAHADGDAQTVVSLYSGPFLDGFFISDAPEFERWADEERARIDRAYGAALERLAQESEAAGDASRAATWWRKRAALEPLNSYVATRLMEALAAAGDRAGAIQHARIHAALLQDELGLEPDPAVTALARRLRDGSGGSPSGRLSDSAEPPAEGQMPAGGRAPTEAPSPRRGLNRPWGQAQLGIGAAVLLLLAAVVILHVARGSRPSATIARTVVLAELLSPDSTLALAVREALRAELESDPGIRVLGDAGMRETLELMKLPTDAAVTNEVAVGIAQRRGIPLVVAGSVTPLGSGVQIVAELVDAPRDSTRLTLFERPASEDDVIPAVTRLARRLRQKVAGTSPDSLPALPQVTTSSLAALKDYVQARQALERLDRLSAVELGEAALVHDTSFALAHYLVADQLWFLDRERLSDEHMIRAYELSAHLPPRERLIVHARYEQLIRDRPDSALVYWQLLAKSYPDEPLAYEGMRWVYRALDQVAAMAAASESAHVRDATFFPLYVSDHIDARVAAGDSAGAFEFARSVADRLPGVMVNAGYAWALSRGNASEALSILPPDDPRRHALLVTLGRLAEARRALDGLAAAPAQYWPRALILQARAEQALGDSVNAARSLAAQALDWARSADLSPPAYARLAERIADVAARAGDPTTVTEVRRFIREKDRSGNLRSYHYASLMIGACAAFAAGDDSSAARLAAESSTAMFYGRSLATVLMMEADARAALGQEATADSLYHRILAHRAFPDGDPETLGFLRRLATAALEGEMTGGRIRRGRHL